MRRASEPPNEPLAITSVAPLLFSLRRWRPGHLLLAWGTYWVGLVAATLGPAVPALLRATGAEDDQGSISINAGDGLRFLVTEKGTTLWSLTATASEAMIWLIGPPLVLWLAWLIAGRRGRDDAIRAPGQFAELPLGHADDIRADRSERQSVHRPGDSASSR
jgi:hypothetical protein